MTKIDSYPIVQAFIILLEFRNLALKLVCGMFVSFNLNDCTEPFLYLM